MELWLIIEVPGGDSTEVAVEVDPHHAVADLAVALAERLGVEGSPPPLYSKRLGSSLDSEELVLQSGLRFGDHLSLGVPPPGPQQAVSVPTDNSTVTLTVVGGPATGRQWSIGTGEFVVGRASSAHIAVDDPTMSRAHLRIIVREGGVWIVDAGSANGTFVEGVAVEGEQEVPLGSVIEAGHSLLRVDTRVPEASPAVDGDGGFVGFNRPPRVKQPDGTRIYRLPAPPGPTPKARLPLMTALGPLVFGIPMVTMGLLMSNGGYLVVMGLVSIVGSPLLALGSHLESRRSGSGAHREQTAEFDDRLAEISGEMETALADEVVERRRRTPDAGELLERARHLRSNLWERRPPDEDFLTVSVGWADQPSQISFEIADGGDRRRREQATEELERWTTAHNVPLEVSLDRHGVIGMCGEAPAVSGMARWVLTQLAVLHSPRDLVVAAAVPFTAQAEWAWLAWLPHLRSEMSPLSGSHLALGEVDAASLIEAIASIVRSRRDERGAQLADSARPTPAVVVLVSEELSVPRASITPVLEDGPGVGVYVVWMGERGDGLPGECGAVLEAVSAPSTVDVLLPNRGERVAGAVLDVVSVEDARLVAQALAPVKDVTAGGVRGQIPRTVALAELLGLADPTPADIAERWHESGFGVDAPVGVSAGGTFVLDMRHDGPHALVGGTTGAGKSELLQTFVAALAADHPPNRVTFLLVDYKGGAAFKDAVHLPHTVGFVTDLDGHLVHRALVSLDAELRYREHLLRDHGVKDLFEMERRVPEHAPPSLLLIVDEFAALAKELPEFVDGVVNVAQRGRSLGIHLILATQRPAGAINDNVRANTNLRIALRMNDTADSEDVIAAKDAALLPRTMPGRAFARTGQAELTEVQVAYVGGHTLVGPASISRPVQVMELVAGQVQRVGRAAEVDDEAPNDLQVLVDLVRSAAELAEIPPPRPPWLEPLPSVLALDQLEPAGADAAILGMVDLPAEQTRQRWCWDLEQAGSLLVYGTSGSGKTTLLRTLAVSLATGHAPAELHLYPVDFASRGLTSLEALPHVGSVVPGDDVERVQRLISMMERELTRRKNLFASVGASTLSEYRRARPDDPLARIVVLLDGYSGFSATFDDIDFGEWLERLPRLVGDGRPLGVHWVITADRRNAAGMTLPSTIATRVVLRMNDDDYSSLGLDGRMARAASLVPGRGFVGPTLDLQVALVGTDPAGDAQAAVVEELGADLTERFGPGAVPVVGSLPTEVSRETAFDGGLADLGLTVPLGIGQTDLAPVVVDLSDGNLLIAGPNRSGRSTALATVALGLHRSNPGIRLFLLAPRRSPLPDLEVWERAARGPAACDDLGAELIDLVDDRGIDDPPVVVILDDGSEIADSTADMAVERIVRRGRDVNMMVIGVSESTAALRTYAGWIPEIRKDRRALLLNPNPDVDGDLVSVRLPRRHGGGLPPGRGYLALDGSVELIQVAS